MARGMMRIITCLTDQHDFRLVLLAAVVCVVAIFTTFKTLANAREGTKQRRIVWILLSGFCAASGIWATHFIAMLAYEAGVPISYHPFLTLLSLFAAFFATSLGFALASRNSKNHSLAGGAIVGIGVAVMHFTGMESLIIGGRLTWDLPLVVASLLIGMAMTSSALVVYRGSNHVKAHYVASALMIGGICGLHFTAMAAAVIEPDPTIQVETAGFDRVMLAGMVTAITLIIMIAGVAALIVDKLQRELARKLAELEAIHKTSNVALIEAERRREADRSSEELLNVERAFQEQLAALVNAAAAGDLSRRIDLSGTSDLSSRLGEGFNAWASTISAVFGQVASVMAALANGDFSKRMEGHFEGELLRLKNDVNKMAEAIHAIASRIDETSGTVESATVEIGAGVADLAHRTDEQASTLQETAASLDQLASTVRQNAKNAQTAKLAAAAAHDIALNSGGIAEQAIDAMSKIDQSSRQITSVVTLIEEIAFQTNILALNAAVEAARAGDAGRGFAVVANEVRALAQRSSQALKDIQRQISSSNNNITHGVKLVTDAATSLNDIVASVKQVAELMVEIAAASQEQSSGINQVSTAVAGMDQMTQQNASLVEQTNTALQSAQAQVTALRQAVAFFKTGGAKPAFRARGSHIPETSSNEVHKQQSGLARALSSLR